MAYSGRDYGLLVEQTISLGPKMLVQMAKFRGGHLRELDCTRGLAVLMVVILHCYTGIGGAADFPFDDY